MGEGHHGSTSRAELLVVQLPSRIQMTFGGWPYRNECWRKSVSLVTIARPCPFAYSQTAASPASQART